MATFGRKFTVQGFKALNSIQDLKVLRNPKNSKLFLSGDGRTVGKVSTTIDLEGDLAIVEMIDEETGEAVPCLVNPGQGGASVEKQL